MWHRVRPLAITLLFTAGTAVAVLAVSWPTTTHAEEIDDSDRMGEYEEEGMKFGNVVVRGELVADGSAAGGWTLVRTLENQSDAPEKLVLEERVLRTETMPSARVEPPATAVVLRNQPIALGPHEKRTIGVRLPKAVGEQITAGLHRKAWVERGRERAFAAEKYDAPVLQATYMTFHVEYFTPLPPGATAARAPDNGITRPAAMPMGPLPRPRAIAMAPTAAVPMAATAPRPMAATAPRPMAPKAPKAPPPDELAAW